MRPLDGIKVLDIATLVAGPYAAASLAEFGAEVIKIEKPGAGDPLRKLGTQSPTGDTYWWLSDGRNKQSVELDLRTPEGAATFRKMAQTADVIVENFRPGTLAKWGIDFEILRADNGGLIMLSITGFGQYGPKSQRAGLARIAEGLVGFTDLTGAPDGPPSLSGASALADYVSGTFGAYGLTLALLSRAKTGRGQQIDIALYEGILRYLDELAPVYHHTGHGRQRLGSETHRSVPHASYLCGDGKWVAIACTNDALFTRLAEAMGRADLLNDTKFATNAARIAHRGEVNGIVEDWTRALDRIEVEARCAEFSVPCGPINDIAAAVDDPQIKHRQSLVLIKHHTLGDILVPNVFPCLSETPGRIDSLGPALGAHNHLKDAFDGKAKGQTSNDKLPAGHATPVQNAWKA